MDDEDYSDVLRQNRILEKKIRRQHLEFAHEKRKLEAIQQSLIETLKSEEEKNDETIACLMEQTSDLEDQIREKKSQLFFSKPSHYRRCFHAETEFAFDELEAEGKRVKEKTEQMLKQKTCFL